MMQDFLTRDNLGNFTFLMFVVVVVTGTVRTPSKGHHICKYY